MINIKRAETLEELETFKAMTSYAFEPSPTKASADKPDPQETDYLSDSFRYLCYANDIPVSSLLSIPMTQNLRGKIYAMQGIAGVSTYPEHRRKGYVKELMDYTFNRGLADGQVFTTLYPFRESFYGNFGYINLPQSREASFAPGKMKDLKNFEINGEINRELIGNDTDRYFSFLKKYENQTHGSSLFPESSYKRMEKSKLWIIFAKVEGEDRGIMVFETTGFEKEIKIEEFLYLDSNAKYVLLDHISRHVDQFSKIVMRISPTDRPETWYFDSNVSITSREWVPSAMGRILDINKMGGMNVGEGSISVKLKDPNCNWNEGVWLLSAENHELHVSTTDEFDIEMTIQGLSAVVYGGYELEDLYLRGWMSNQDHNLTLTKLFPPVSASILSIF